MEKQNGKMVTVCEDDSMERLNGLIGANPAFSAYCECRDMCFNANKQDNGRYAYFYVGLFFGLWYICSALNCYCRVKERSQLPGAQPLPMPAPVVPTSLKTMSNRLFTLLLPAWICDTLSNTIISSLLMYFVRYIVQPEFSDGCKGGEAGMPSWSKSSSGMFCTTMNVATFCFLGVLLAAFLGTPIWLLLERKFGKRTAWLMWSFSLAVTNPLYFFVGKGDAMLCIIVSTLNGLPIGAKFLSDSILADVIDYDEFLTGNRNEATYTMFKSFLPKVASIPASAIPIVLLDAFGHIPPIDGEWQDQPQSVKNYIRITICGLTTTLSLCSFLLKSRFPLRSKNQTHQICEGIGRHMNNDSAIDPISGVDYQIVLLSTEEQADANRVDSFPGAAVAEQLLEDPAAGAARLVTRSLMQVGGSLLMMLLSLLLTFGTWSEIAPEDEEVTCNCDHCSCSFLNATNSTVVEEDEGMPLSFLPVFGLAGVGGSITLLAFTGLRASAALSIRRKPPAREALKKISAARKQAERARDFDASICAGYRKTPSRSTVFRRRKTNTTIHPDPDPDSGYGDGSEIFADAQTPQEALAVRRAPYRGMRTRVALDRCRRLSLSIILLVYHSG